MRYRQEEDQQFKVVLGFTASLKSALATGDLASKQNKAKKTPHALILVAFPVADEIPDKE